MREGSLVFLVGAIAAFAPLTRGRAPRYVRPLVMAAMSAQVAAAETDISDFTYRS